MRIHMIAICGVGMAPLAVLLKRAGHQVTGSDKAAFAPMGEVLERAEIDIHKGFSAACLSRRPDLVIVGNAVPSSNPEAREAERLGLERLSFPRAVARFFLDGHESLVVAGTHGKTTTSGMLARALQAAGCQPGYLIGGLIPDLGDLARPAGGRYFVIEGDEYDSAYFDKVPKFLHYQPAAAVITSVEFDHADIYRDLEHVKAQFCKLASLLPSSGVLLGCGDSAELLDAVGGAAACRFVTYGKSPSNDWRPLDLKRGEQGSSFRPSFRGKPEEAVTLQLAGDMNVLNALAVYALCRELKLPGRAAARALAGFHGAVRRQERVGEARGVVVIDDFAHHPTAVAATLAAMRQRFPGRSIRAVFEPRSNTSRRAVFQEHYAEALATADAVVLSAVFAKDNDPLSPGEMLSTDRLVRDLEAAGIPAWAGEGADAILDRLAGEVCSGEVVVCMSNGAFGDLPRRLVTALGSAEP